MTIEEMIASADLKDDFEIAAGENKFKLGDLRKVHSAKAAEIAKQQKAFETEKARVNKLSEDALALWESIKDKAPKKGDPPKTGDDDDMTFADDPWLARAGKALTKLAKQLEDAQKAQTERAEKLEKALSDGFRYVMTKEYERDWNSIPEAERPKDKTWRDYLKVAQDNKVINEWGLPDPRAAYEKETAGDREARIKKAEYDRGVAEGKAAASVQQPRPGTAGPVAAARPKGDKNYADANELIEDAFADTEINKLLSGTPAN